MQATFRLFHDFAGSAVESNGQLKVDEYLRVDGYTDIYAIGDCNNTKDIKLGYAATEQAKLLGKNFVCKATDKPETPWKEGQCLC